MEKHSDMITIKSLQARMNRLLEKRNLPLLSVCMNFKIAIEQADLRSFYPYCPRGGFYDPGLGSKERNHGLVY